MRLAQIRDFLAVVESGTMSLLLEPVSLFTHYDVLHSLVHGTPPWSLLVLVAVAELALVPADKLAADWAVAQVLAVLAPVKVPTAARRRPDSAGRCEWGIEKKRGYAL